MASADTDVTRQLEAEARQRPRTATAAALAGGLIVLGAVYGAVGLHPPRVGVVQGLAPALTGVADAHVDPRTAGIAFAAHHAGRIIVSSLISAAGIALIAVVLTYLYGAVRARRPELTPYVRTLGIAGPIVVALAGLVTAIVFSINSQHYLDHADRSRQAADHVSTATTVIVTQSLGLAGALALAFALVMIGLNAMRVGLLTRFMGVLAIIAGVLFVIPVLGSGLPIVQAFWLIALALILSGRSPAGMPPAWEQGVAVPWPTQQQIREARTKARGDEAVVTAPAPEPVVPAGAGGSRRRKRKRR